MNVLDAQAASPVNPPQPSTPAEVAPAPAAFAQLLTLFFPPVPAVDGAPAALDRASADPETSVTEAAQYFGAIDLANLNHTPRIASAGTPVAPGGLPGARTPSVSLRESVDLDSIVEDLNVTSGPAMQNFAPLKTLSGASEAAGLAENVGETEAIASEPRRRAVVGGAPAVPVSPSVNTQTVGSFEFRDASGLNTTGVPIGTAPFAVRAERPTAKTAVEPVQTSSGDNRKNDFPMVAAATAAPTAALALPETADGVTGKAPIEVTVAAQKSLAESGDADGAQAQSLSRDDRSAVAANLFSTAAAHQAQHQSANAAKLPTTERPLEIDIEPSPMPARDAEVASAPRDASSDQQGVPAPSSADAQDPSRKGWQRNSRANQESLYSPAIAGAAGASDVPHDNTVTAPEWRPMVDRLARDIADHLRVGKQEAVLQLDPPDLGRVKIDLRIEDGQLHVRIAAEGHESQGLIENHLPELQQALRAGQIDVGELRVTQGEWNGGGTLAQNFNQSPQGRQETARGLANATAVDEPMTDSLAQAARSADGRVSMWA